MNPPPPPPPYDPTGASSRAADDAALLRAMANGDERAFAALYDRWHALVNGVVMRILRQSDEVEDVVEETFWQLWRQASRYDASRGNAQSWILTIARSRALDRVRAATRRREDPLGGDCSGNGELRQHVTSDDPALDVLADERRTIVKAALAELPAEQREALELGYFAGLTQAEIAERTGAPLGTIKTRMRLAMQKLRGRLQPLREDSRS